MAILLEEEGLLDRARIYATDINDGVLRAGARRASSRSTRMQEYTRELHRAPAGTESFSRLLHGDGTTARCFDPALHAQRRVLAAQPRHRRSFNEFHVILCRNVLIYFDRELQDRVHELFYDSLVDVRRPRRWAARRRSGSRRIEDALREARRRARSSTGRSMTWRASSSSIGASWGGLARAAASCSRGLPADFRRADRRRPAPRRATRDDAARGAARTPQRRCRCARPRTRTPLEPGSVYVAPADYHLLVERGHFALVDGGAGALQPARRSTCCSSRPPTRYGDRAGRRRPDRRQRRRRARACAAIARRGGLAIVQDPATAERPDDAARPRSRPARPTASLPLDGDRGRCSSRARCATARRERDREPRQHPARRRPAGEPARARGDARAARPATRVARRRARRRCRRLLRRATSR